MTKAMPGTVNPGAPRRSVPSMRVACFCPPTSAWAVIFPTTLAASATPRPAGCSSETVPAAQRTNLEVMRTDSASFSTLVNSRRWRKDDFYKHPVGRIGLCNVSVPARPVAPAK